MAARKCKLIINQIQKPSNPKNVIHDNINEAPPTKCRTIQIQYNERAGARAKITTAAYQMHCVLINFIIFGGGSGI